MDIHLEAFRILYYVNPMAHISLTKYRSKAVIVSCKGCSL